MWRTSCAPRPPTILVAQQAVRFRHALPYPFLSQCFLDPTCDFLLSPSFFLSNHSLLSLPSSSLHFDILSFTRYLPSLKALAPPARLFSHNSCTPAPAAYQLWLPPSWLLHSQSIFLFCLLHIYLMTYMLLPKPCLSLRPLSPSLKSLTLRIVTPSHPILLPEQLPYMSFPNGVPFAFNHAH